MGRTWFRVAWAVAVWPVAIGIAATALGAADQETLIAIRLDDEGRFAYRGGRPGEASRLLTEAVNAAPGWVQPLVDSAKVDVSCFDVAAAQAKLRRAYKLAADEPSVLSSLARVAAGISEKLQLLRAFLDRARSRPDAERPQLESALFELALHRILGDASPWSPASSLASYRLPLCSFRSGGLDSRLGIGVRVSLNGSKPLRILLDSGAGKTLVLSQRKVDRLGVRYFSSGSLYGVGPGSARSTRLALADEVNVGPVSLRNGIVEVTEREVCPEVDGVMGLSVFDGFRITLDLAHSQLELDPLGPPERRAWPSGDDPQVVQLNHLLLVRTRFGRDHSGYFVFDTGAAYSAIDTAAERPAPLSAMLPLFSANGPMRVNLQSGQTLHVNSCPLPTARLLSVDLSRLSEREGFQISGLLGLSSLLGKQVTVNYRDGVFAVGR